MGKEDKSAWEGQKGMKIIMPGLCPHCSKEIMLTFAMTMPQLLSAHKPEDFEDAKKKVLTILDGITFESETHKKMAIDYVNDTLFGPSEVDDVLEQILPKGKE
jgi:hypothetical protein